MKNRNLSGADAGRYAEGRPNARSVAFDHFGSPQGVMAAMYPYMFQDTSFNIDDFNTFDVDYNRWRSSGDAGEELFSAEGGNAQATVLTDNGVATFYGPACLNISKNPGVEFRWQIDVVTGLRYEVGLADITDGIVNDFIITDTDIAKQRNEDNFLSYAVLHQDTDQTLTTARVFAGSGGGSGRVNIGTFSPTADTWYTTRIQTVVEGTGVAVEFYIFDSNSSRMTLVSSGKQSFASGDEITTTAVINSTLSPWFAFGPRDATGKTAKLDYVAWWQDR